MSNIDDRMHSERAMTDRRAAIRPDERRANPETLDESDDMIRPAHGVDDRQQTSDGSGVSVPGLSKTTVTPTP